jgi:hypothetical protein
MSAICVGLKKNNKQETIYSTFLTGCCLPYCTCLISCLVCRVIAVLCILWPPYVYSLSVYLWCSVFVGLGICCTVYLLYCEY